jgi:hypothetical protein
MVVGISHMRRQGSLWKPVKDSAKVRAWLRLSGWRRGKGVGINVTRPRAIQKSLADRTGRHTGPARGFVSILPGSDPRMTRQYTKLAPKRHNNKLLAEVIALKVNIAASQLGKTPPGFGELEYAMSGSFLDGMSVRAISEAADSLMTYWDGHVQAEYDTLYNALWRINRAFEAPLDTIRFERPDSFFTKGYLAVRGSVLIGDVPFLRMPSPFRPTVLAALSHEVDAPEEFDDEDAEEEAEDTGVPIATRLYQNYPNPFNPATTIAFRLGGPARVTIRVYSLLGQEVGVVAESEEFDEGHNTVEFVADGLASGVYLYRIATESLDDAASTSVETRKMLLVK